MDLSNKTMTKFIESCNERNNLIPLLGDADKIFEYENDLKVFLLPKDEDDNDNDSQVFNA